MQKSCAYCGKTFEAKRINAALCSGRCRQSYSRRNRKGGTNPVGFFEGKDDFFRYEKLQQVAPQAATLIIGMIKRYGQVAAREALEIAYIAAFPAIDRLDAAQVVNKLLTDENARLYSKINDLLSEGKGRKGI